MPAVSTIFELIDAGDAHGVRALLATEPAIAAEHDEQGLTALMRAAYRGGEVFEAVRAANPPLEPFDRIVVGVVRNPTHKQPFFTIEERLELLEEVLSPFPNVVVAGFSTLVVEYARAWGASALVKGLRAVSDFEWELQMAHLNKRIAPEIETVFLMSSPRHSFLSSSGVRELAAFGGPIADFVPPVVAEAFARRT